MANTQRIQVWIEGDKRYRGKIKTVAIEAETSQECLLRVATDNLLAMDIQSIKQMVAEANCAPSDSDTPHEGNN